VVVVVVGAVVVVDPLGDVVVVDPLGDVVVVDWPGPGMGEHAETSSTTTATDTAPTVLRNFPLVPTLAPNAVFDRLPVTVGGEPSGV
jgi:hypothetical protein